GASPCRRATGLSVRPVATCPSCDSRMSPAAILLSPHRLRPWPRSHVLITTKSLDFNPSRHQRARSAGAVVSTRSPADQRSRERWSGAHDPNSTALDAQPPLGEQLDGRRVDLVLDGENPLPERLRR